MSGPDAANHTARRAHEAVGIAIRQCLHDTGRLPGAVIVSLDVWDGLKDPVTGGVTYPDGVTIHIIKALAPGSVCALKEDPWAHVPAYMMEVRL